MNLRSDIDAISTWPTKACLLLLPFTDSLFCLIHLLGAYIFVVRYKLSKDKLMLTLMASICKTLLAHVTCYRHLLAIHKLHNYFTKCLLLHFVTFCYET